MIATVDYLKVKVDGQLVPLRLPDDVEIAQWEQSNGYRLPVSFKEALKAWSGKTPTNLRVELSDGTKLAFCCLYHVYEDLEKHQSYLLDTASVEDLGYGPDLVEFSSSGNLFYCLDYTAHPEDPPVVLIDSAEEPESLESKKTLAPTFSEFLAKYTAPLDQAPA